MSQTAQSRNFVLIWLEKPVILLDQALLRTREGVQCPPKIVAVIYGWFNRVILNLLTFGLAVTVPWLDLFVSLVGSIKMSTLALMVPALIDTASHWGDLGRGRWRLWKNVLIFLFGLAGLVLGAYVSTVNIIRKFQEGN